MNKEPLRLLLEGIEIPESAYENAKARYEALGDWLGKESNCRGYSPHVFAQGSFRLGTAIRPIRDAESYDLDLVCSLGTGISHTNFTQSDLKNLVGAEIEKYRSQHNFRERMEEKHRCWCLNYQDSLAFHMDILPTIPAHASIRQDLRESLVKSQMNFSLAESISVQSLSLTDNRRPDYRIISPRWQTTNPEGYALWFEEKMKTKQQILNEQALLTKAAKIDELPVFRRKTPLQQAIQLLKRHRDKMFETAPDLKPISIIITTLAALAYQGEIDLKSTLSTILGKMGTLVRPAFPRVANPVNLAEDFADKWRENPLLETNFRKWLTQAQIAFDFFAKPPEREMLLEKSFSDMGVRMNPDLIDGSFAGGAGSPKSIHIIRQSEVLQPWALGRI